jgi:hypothetical protein
LASSMFEDASSFDQNLGRWNLSSVVDLNGLFTQSGLSCNNYDNFLNGAALTAMTPEVSLGGVGYTPQGEPGRNALIARGWVIDDFKCPDAWPLEDSAPVIIKVPTFDNLVGVEIPALRTFSMTVSGSRLDQISSASLGGQSVTISAMTATSVRFELPALAVGNYDLTLETDNGKAIYTGAFRAISIPEAQPTKSAVLTVEGLNAKSSFITRPGMQQITDWVGKDASVVCIAYSDRPGLVSRAKAKSRAEHACRVARAAGATTRVFVYSKAPGLAETVKLATR